MKNHPVKGIHLFAAHKVMTLSFWNSPEDYGGCPLNRFDEVREEFQLALYHMQIML